MILGERQIAGVVRERWTDDNAGTYYELAADGVTVVAQRPFTTIEKAWLADDAAMRASRANFGQLRTAGLAQLQEFLVEIAKAKADRATAARVVTWNNAALSTAIVALMDHIIVSEQATARLARIVLGATDSTDIG